MDKYDLHDTMVTGTWEQAAQHVRDALEREEEDRFEVSRRVLGVLRWYAGKTPPHHTSDQVQESCYRELAQRVSRSPEWCRQHALVAAHYGERRCEDQRWSWHLTVIQTAHRLGEPVPTVEARALAGGLSITQLRALEASGVVERVAFKGTCPDCGFRIAVHSSPRQEGVRAAYLGRPVACPVCAADPERPTVPLGTLA